jgi:hypothetical protein
MEIMQQQEQQHHSGKENIPSSRILTADSYSMDWVDTMVSCAQTVNKAFVRHTCRICQIYSDKQVEFERIHNDDSDHGAASPVDRANWKVPHLPEVEFYRQFLFDEESVMEGVLQRQQQQQQQLHQTSQEDESATISTQRTK